MKERNKGIDILKCICCFMVICIHMPFPMPISDYVSCLCRIAVPIFLIITGYFYDQVKNNKKELIQIKKMINLYLIGNIIYFFFFIISNLNTNKSLLIICHEIINIKSIIKFIVFNESPFAGHLWYLGAVAYVLIIILIFEKKWSRKKLYPFIIPILTINIVLGQYSQYLTRNFIFLGIPYFLIGDYIKTEIKIKIYKTDFLLFIFIILSMIELLILKKNELVVFREHYICTTFLAVLLFFKMNYNSYEKSMKFIDFICYIGNKLSLGIYIIHPIIISLICIVLRKIKPYNIYIIVRWLSPFIIFVLSILLVMLLYYIVNTIKIIKSQHKESYNQKA